MNCDAELIVGLWDGLRPRSRRLAISQGLVPVPSVVCRSGKTRQEPAFRRRRGREPTWHAQDALLGAGITERSAAVQFPPNNDGSAISITFVRAQQDQNLGIAELTMIQSKQDLKVHLDALSRIAWSGCTSFLATPRLALCSA